MTKSLYLVFLLIFEMGTVSSPTLWDAEIYVWKAWHKNEVLKWLKFALLLFSSTKDREILSGDKHCNMRNGQNLMKSIIIDENVAFISLWMPYSHLKKKIQKECFP